MVKSKSLKGGDKKDLKRLDTDFLYSVPVSLCVCACLDNFVNTDYFEKNEKKITPV